MRKMMPVTVAVALAAAGCAKARKGADEKFERLGPVAVVGEVGGPNNVSGASFVGGFLLLVSNETAHVEVLKKDGDRYAVAAPVVLEGRGPVSKDDRLDLEAVAAEGATVYAIGSHGRMRDGTRAPPRDRLFRFTLNKDGTAAGLSTVSLRPVIGANAVLKPSVPGKEGGANIEGLAARGGKLFVGFRSPVLADELVPVLVTTFDRPEAGELRFVRLGGRGVRDLAAVQGGFLILAGPAVGGTGGEFYLYFWDGSDCAPGANPAGTCEPLCEVPHGEKQSPEGLAVVTEGPTAYELLIVWDGPKNGNPTRYRLRK